MPKPSHLAQFGLGKEAVPGTAVPATMWAPWKSLAPKDEVKIIKDEGNRGAPVATMGAQAGPRGSSLDWGGDVIADVIGWPLVSLLPDVVVTGAAAPYTTAFSVLCTGDTQPPALTATIYDPLGTWQYPGLQVSELQIKFSADGFVEYSAKGIGWGYVIGTTPTTSYSALRPQPNWGITVKINNVPVFVQDGELTIKRKVEAIRGANGTQNPYRIWSGDVEVDGKLTLVMEDTSQRTAFQNVTPQSLDVSFTQGSGATQSGLAFHCSQAVYTEGSPTYGKDYIELPVTWEGLGNTADVGASGGYSPIKATVTNAMPSGTYK
ncbi:phage tail tube protein [Kitasatospora sp. NPDC056076]|uniref:phage tail tube protein n=1 Tax=Kitasatospora sp. NPDC056076 TaxID=3345703 RepID=UPI0035D869CD